MLNSNYHQIAKYFRTADIKHYMMANSAQSTQDTTQITTDKQHRQSYDHTAPWKL